MLIIIIIIKFHKDNRKRNNNYYKVFYNLKVNFLKCEYTYSHSYIQIKWIDNNDIKK